MFSWIPAGPVATLFSEFFFTPFWVVFEAHSFFFSHMGSFALAMF